MRIEDNGGRKEWVLMDAKGPGAIVGIWMPFNYSKKLAENYIRMR